MHWLKLSALACSLVWAAPLAHAAEYPVRPIKLIVPYAAGGPTDVLGRMVGDYLSRDLKQPVVVENKAGAQGAIGAEAAARSEPDGYTLFFTAASIFVLNPLLYKKLPYDPTRDFRLLALVTDLPDVPTMAESGYPEYGVSVWYGVSAPAKLPDDIAQKLTASLNKALNDEAFRASLDKVGFPPLRPKSQAEIERFVVTDRARWAGVIKALNISLD